MKGKIIIKYLTEIVMLVDTFFHYKAYPAARFRWLRLLRPGIPTPFLINFKSNGYHSFKGIEEKFLVYSPNILIDVRTLLVLIDYCLDFCSYWVESPW